MLCICGLLHLLIFARNFCSLLQCNLPAFANFCMEVLLFFALEALPIVLALKALFGLPFFSYCSCRDVRTSDFCWRMFL